MKIAIVGSRNIKNEDAVYKIICDAIPRNCSEIVSGGASGIDKLAEKYAAENGIHLTVFLPDYEKYGRSAPLLRNTEIIEYADIVYAFWDYHSRGTSDTINKCLETGKQLKIYKI